MASNLDVLDGVVDMLTAGCPGVNVYKTPPQQVSAPAVMVSGFSFEPHTVLVGASRKFSVELTVAVSGRHVDEFDRLLGLVDPGDARSIQAALEDDSTLGNRVSSTAVTAVGQLRELTVGEVPFWAMTIDLEVWD
jgi:hypothetical protein